MGMTAARAVLQHLKQEGSALQQQLNQRTSRLAATLNAYFEAENVPLELVHFGSLFRLLPQKISIYCSITCSKRASIFGKGVTVFCLPPIQTQILIT
jgi:glutamate-1-semialdehyde aminotransferase